MAARRHGGNRASGSTARSPIGRSAILHYDRQHGLGSVYVGAAPVRTLAALDTTGIAAVIDHDLDVWHGNVSTDLGRLGADVDGLAVADDGTLYVSGPAGIVRLRSFDAAPERIVTAIHGPLRLRGDRLYVLWRAGSTVLRIAPHAEQIETATITIPPEHPSIFREGPASDRQQSLDGGIRYTMISAETGDDRQG